jgi:hypothetical protein
LLGDLARQSCILHQGHAECGTELRLRHGAAVPTNKPISAD